MFREVRNADGSLDVEASCKKYQEEHRCRWNEACLEIKRRFAEARAYFGAPSEAECK